MRKGSDFMRVIVMSDSHGRDDRIQELLDLYPDASYFIHCGDIECDPQKFLQLICVQGNNDLYYQYKNEIKLNILGHNILIMHSHQFSYYERSRKMAEHAIEKDCEIFLYGHTHVLKDEVVNGVRLINPGSLWRSRDEKGPSYIILDISEHEVKCEKVMILGKE